MKERIQKIIRTKGKFIIAISVFVVLGIVILLIPNGGAQPIKVKLSDQASVRTICELATSRNYYHNVANFEKKPGDVEKYASYVFLFPLGWTANVGYKQYWLEYSGIVETGIDAGQIQISEPREGGIVDVYVPDAKVLNVYADENSFEDPLSETGWFTSISSEEKNKTFAEAQSAMEEQAKNDQPLLLRTKNNAKLLLERYIVNTGKGMGVEYTVNWLDSPLQ